MWNSWVAVSNVKQLSATQFRMWNSWVAVSNVKQLNATPCVWMTIKSCDGCSWGWIDLSAWLPAAIEALWQAQELARSEACWSTTRISMRSDVILLMLTCWSYIKFINPQYYYQVQQEKKPRYCSDNTSISLQWIWSASPSRHCWAQHPHTERSSVSIC